MLEKKKYDICAIGNAIVDEIFEIEGSFLREINIEKGQMTLIDDIEYEQILKNFDEENRMLVCGGSVANSLNLASRLGADCFFQGMLSCDYAGDYFIEDLKNYNIDTQANAFQRMGGNTGRCMVMITPDGQRTMCTSLGVAGSLTPGTLFESAIIDSDYLYIEGYMVSSKLCFQSIVQSIGIAKQNNTKIALTFSDPSIPLYFKNQLKTIVDNKTYILFCNEEEATIYTGKNNIEEAIEELKKYSEIVIVTKGKNGAIAVNGERTYTVDGNDVTCIDSNGAGDAFAGSFMYGMTRKKDFYEIMIIANTHASKIVTQWGARLEIV